MGRGYIAIRKTTESIGQRSGDLRPEEVVRLEDDRVVLLDQRRLPETLVELECRSAADVARAIRALAVRGAPAIGVAAAMGYALAARRGEDLNLAASVLSAARPTAANLAWALAEMRNAGTEPEALARRANELHREEVSRCHAMAEHALPLFPVRSDAASDSRRVSGSGLARALTHCNTGALATAGHGTALGALRTAFAHDRLEHVYVGETRPLEQGGRLTAWELERAGIPFAVIVDGAAGALMARGDVTHVVVGADRIAANGDVANKIGTYGLAVLAAHHGVPLVVVAPSSSIDPATMTGEGIEIEERAAAEITERFPAYNPAFDVTPAPLVTAIVTETGIHRPPYDFSPPRPSPSWGGAGKGDKLAARRTVRQGTAESRERSIPPPAPSGGGEAGKFLPPPRPATGSPTSPAGADDGQEPER